MPVPRDHQQEQQQLWSGANLSLGDNERKGGVQALNAQQTGRMKESMEQAQVN